MTTLFLLALAVMFFVITRQRKTEHKEHIKARLRMIEKWREQLDKQIEHEKYLNYLRNLPTVTNQNKKDINAKTNTKD